MITAHVMPGNSASVRCLLKLGFQYQQTKEEDWGYKSSRPAITDHDAPVADCDKIYIGFPVWWYVAPTIINTFLEAYDFSGKKIVLFATSGGSGFGKTVANLQGSCPGAEIVEGKILNRASDAEIKKLVEM